ncbi:restriction endonuclease subunit S [Streptomyces griseofuscus]|uniref:restriction endonuclease subunit S n=1 Tax=Streptomyces griseofuscus TaxID=146922 RepID=UPI00368CD8BB
MTSDGWPIEPLSHLLDGIEAGKSPNLPDSPAGPGEWGVLKVSAVHISGFKAGENKRIETPDNVDTRYQIHPGDLLVSRANTPELVGSACIVPELSTGLLLSDKTLRLQVDPTRALAEYVNICLASSGVRRQIVNAASGSSRSMQNIGQKAIERLRLPAPPIEEQRRIVEVIDSFTELERGIEASIAKFEALRSGLMEELVELECGQFGEVLRQGPQNGIYKPASSYGLQGTPIVRIDSFSRGKSDLTRGLLRVSVKRSEIARYGLDLGDIVINRVNTPDLVGKSTSVRCLIEPTIFESNMMRCKLNRAAADPVFTETWLGSSKVRRYFLQRAKSAISQASINGDDVRNCPFPKMSLPEQLAFLERLNAVDDQRLAEAAELAKLRQLKQGLVDDLLSGRVAVSAAAA